LLTKVRTDDFRGGLFSSITDKMNRAKGD